MVRFGGVRRRLSLVDLAGGRGACSTSRHPDKANGNTGSSEQILEPGNTIVPTLCVPDPVGSANDGDLPLVGDGGGEPKSESSSSPLSIAVDDESVEVEVEKGH